MFGNRCVLKRSVLVVALAVTLLPSVASSHEIPNDVTVQAFVRPEGPQLRLLVRVPLEAMRDINWPTLGPGYLDLVQAEGLLDDAATIWLANDIRMYEDDVLLPVPAVQETRLSLPSDRSFASFDEARDHLSGPRLATDTELFWEQAMLDVMFEYPIESDQAEFSMDPGLERLGLRVLTVVRFLPPDGRERAFEFLGNPGRVRLDPRWYQAALTFVSLGFFHILDGVDHLLFLLCLVIPFRLFRPLLLLVTSFTVAHSITLVASAFSVAPDALWFPPLVETLIAISIVYMAIENIVGSHVERRWMITFGFGLIHGFGFSFALGETLQFAGSHLLTSLFAFNIGVELGQLLVLAFLIPALALTFRYVLAERMGTIILSVLVGHTAWHWMMDRAEILGQYPWPEPSVATLAIVLRWLMVILTLAFGVWLVSGALSRWAAGSEASASK